MKGEALVVNGHCKKPSASRPLLMADRAKRHCYSLGPLLLTGAGIGSAGVLLDPQLEQWVVNLHWPSDDFATAIANANDVNHEYAVILDGVVQGAFTLDPAGIGIKHVPIVSDYSRNEAIVAAASIMGIAPSQVPTERWKSSDG